MKRENALVPNLPELFTATETLSDQKCHCCHEWLHAVPHGQTKRMPTELFRVLLQHCFPWQTTWKEKYLQWASDILRPKWLFLEPCFPSFPVPWRLATPSYWGCNCELNSTIPLAWGFTVLEINLGIFASFSLASQSKRPLRGSREYFPWKTPGTGNPWSECLQTPRKALAQEHRHASIYSELWVIMLRFC